MCTIIPTHVERRKYYESVLEVFPLIFIFSTIACGTSSSPNIIMVCRITSSNGRIESDIQHPQNYAGGGGGSLNAVLAIWTARYSVAILTRASPLHDYRKGENVWQLMCNYVFTHLIAVCIVNARVRCGKPRAFVFGQIFSRLYATRWSAFKINSFVCVYFILETNWYFSV